MHAIFMSGLLEYIIDNYKGWAYITGFIAFIGIWLYAISSWGLLIGLMAGWIPALIGSFIVGIAWPLFVIILIAVILFSLNPSFWLS